MSEEKAVKKPESKTIHATLAEALVAAQKEMPAVEPDSVNPHFKSKFVSLGHLIAKARPVLNKHGIAIAQFPSSNGKGNPILVTILMHTTGQQLRFDAPLLLPKQDPQGQGSAITYMRRYALASALGISDQEDDDGNAGSETAGKTNGKPAEARISQPTADALRARMKAAGADHKGLALFLVSKGITHDPEVDTITTGLLQLTQEWAEELDGRLEKKAKEKAAA